MNTIFVPKNRLEERKKQKENCLHFLYYVEDIFDYNYDIISKCIDELQKLEIKEDDRFKEEKNDKSK